MVSQKNFKNIQIIDGAENCTYSIFQATEDEFLTISSRSGQNIVFDDELDESEIVTNALKAIWKRPILKRDAMGIHGTIFCGVGHKKQYFPVSRRYLDIDPSYVNEYERELIWQSKGDGDEK